MLKIFLPNGMEVQAEGQPSELSLFLRELNSSSPQELPATKPTSTAAQPTNNRQAVLKTMHFLQNQGRNVAHIAEIKVAFRQLFPQESGRLVDQTLRDLVNKTGQLRRVGRGLFQVVENRLNSDSKANH
ncbi:MAG: hypothetical protein KDC71_18365 [Acidobacteria bacterium]|nr:hypothetical protein [Acidobacteriota bacterium]